MSISRETIFSTCRLYRYSLWREWGTLPGDDDLFAKRSEALRRDKFVQFICLNPSTADETKDDPTVRRCIGFAQAWGYGAFCMTNLFAYRSTAPLDMIRHKEPIGADNDKHIAAIAQEAGLIIAAWGTMGNHRGRASAVSKTIPNLHAIGRTNDGFPRHPLYVAGAAIPAPYP